MTPAKACGCKVWVVKACIDFRIDYCELHAAAPELLVALQKMAAIVMALGGIVPRTLLELIKRAEGKSNVRD